MGHTKLHSAATQGSIDDTIVELRQGADPNARDLSGNTPLHWAARRGHAEVARILVAEGSDLTSRNNRGNTAIMVADAWDQKPMVKLLKGIEKRTRHKVLHKEAQYGRERVEHAVVRAKQTYDRQTAIDREERAYLEREMKRQQKIQEVEWRAARSEGKAKDRMKARARATRAAQTHNELKRELDFKIAQEREHLHYLPQEEELLQRKMIPLGSHYPPMMSIPSPSPDQHGPHAHFNPNGHYDPHGRYIDHTTSHRSDGMRYSDMQAHHYKHQGKGKYVEVEHHVPRRQGISPNPPRPKYFARPLVSPPKPGFASSSSRGLTLPEARRKASGKSRPLQHIEYSHTPADTA
eukprot:gene12866-21408_t